MNYEMVKKFLSSKQVADLVGDDTIRTPFELIDEILDKLPVEIWSNPNIKLLDPACGRGAFLVAAKHRFVSAGLEEKHVVQNMLYGVDLDSRDVNVAQVVIDPENKYNANNNIVCDNSLTREWNMKFDVVVGNPPYQHSREDSKNTLYQHFYKQAVDLLVYDGVLAFITPTAMLKGLAGKKVDKVKMPAMMNPQVINITDLKTKHFPRAGSSFCYFVVRNNQYSGATEIITDWGSSNHTFDGRIPNSQDISTAMSIMKKCYSGNNHFNVTTSDVGKKSPVVKSGGVEVIRTINADGSLDTLRVKLSNKSHPLQDSPKVMMTILGRKAMVDYSHTLIPSAHHLMASVPTTNDRESESFMSLFNTTLRKFYERILDVKDNCWYYNFARNLSPVPLDRIWTDEELYAHFNLTKEEIKLIEDTIK